MVLRPGVARSSVDWRRDGMRSASAAVSSRSFALATSSCRRSPARAIAAASPCDIVHCPESGCSPQSTHRSACTPPHVASASSLPDRTDGNPRAFLTKLLQSARVFHSMCLLCATVLSDIKLRRHGLLTWVQSACARSETTVRIAGTRLPGPAAGLSPR